MPQVDTDDIASISHVSAGRYVVTLWSREGVPFTVHTCSTQAEGERYCEALAAVVRTWMR